MFSGRVLRTPRLVSIVHAAARATPPATTNVTLPSGEARQRPCVARAWPCICAWRHPAPPIGPRCRPHPAAHGLARRPAGSSTRPPTARAAPFALKRAPGNPRATAAIASCYGGAAAAAAGLVAGRAGGRGAQEAFVALLSNLPCRLLQAECATIIVRARAAPRATPATGAKAQLGNELMISTTTPGGPRPALQRLGATRLPSARLPAAAAWQWQ